MISQRFPGLGHKAQDLGLRVSMSAGNGLLQSLKTRTQQSVLKPEAAEVASSQAVLGLRWNPEWTTSSLDGSSENSSKHCCGLGCGSGFGTG